MADRTLVVKLVGDEADLLRSYSKAGRATKQFGATTDTALGKADKRLRTLKTAGAGLAGGFIATEVLSNLTTFIDKASESERVLTQVRQGLQNTGQSWDRYGEQIDKTVRQQSRLGFDDEDLLQSFDKFNRQVGNVTKALNLNALAMDVARGRSISLESATTLVTKAASGQRGALTRLGIEVDKNATKIDLLRTLTEKYGGSAKAAGNDAATAQERLGVAVENVQESIGTLLLPVVGDLADNLSEAADAASNVIDGLHGIGTAKIPVLNIPVNFTFPGTDTKVGQALLKVFSKTNPITGVTSPLGQVKNIGAVVGRLTGGGGDSSARTPRAGKQPPVVIQTETNLDGVSVARSTTKVQEKDLRRNPRAKRGPNSAYR